MKKTLQVINRMKHDGVIDGYAIGRAVAAIYYLEPAATLDIDIFVFLPQSPGSTLLSLSPIYDYLAKLGYKTQKEYVVIDKWPVQFLPPADSLEEEAVAKAKGVNLGNIETHVMTAEHLVAIALKIGRPKDHARIVDFLQMKAVSLPKLKAVLSRHGLEGKWQAFERKYLAQ